MPTGYTAGVQDGTVTDFSEFALQCARNFGALVTMRDDPWSTPIPERFEASEYARTAVVEAQQKLDEFHKLTVKGSRRCSLPSEKRQLPAVRRPSARGRRSASGTKRCSPRSRRGCRRPTTTMKGWHGSCVSRKSPSGSTVAQSGLGMTAAVAAGGRVP